MRICLISIEIFAWGKYGGFGRSTRMIGRELARRGVEVSAIVPRRAGQNSVEVLDGIRVFGFDILRPDSVLDLYRQADADIYHSQEPSFSTYLAQLAWPDRKHVVTFRDTRNLKDWWVEFQYPSVGRWQVLSNFLYEDHFLVRHAVRRADRQYAASKMLIEKARKKYRLEQSPLFLPSPVPFAVTCQKSERPSVCFAARLDRRKRPQLYFELARLFPEIQFVAIGVSQDPAWERELREKYEGLPNLELRGFIDQFRSEELQEIYSKSWIFVNTSARESLPTSFIEAVGHQCALLSEIDPDGFSSQFGYHVRDGDYVAGLRFLLEADRWRTLGQRGSEYVRDTFSVDRAIEQHLQMYEDLLKPT